MDTICMNSKNSKTFDTHRLNLSEKVNLLLYQTLTFTIHGKIEKTLYKNNIFKISALTWNEEFELVYWSYSISDIQDYFEYILKKHGEKMIILQQKHR